MFSQLQDLMHWRMSLLMSGRYKDLSEEYLYPLPIYLAGNQHVVRSPAEMETALNRLSKLTSSSGVARTHVAVRAIELPRQGRFRVWVAFRHLDKADKVLGTGTYVHYCRLTEAGIKTEMTDFPDCRGGWLDTEQRRVTA